MKIFIIILAIFLTSCKLNKVVNHHGIHNLEAKSQELLINQTNINQIKNLIFNLKVLEKQLFQEMVMEELHLDQC